MGRREAVTSGGILDARQAGQIVNGEIDAALGGDAGRDRPEPRWDAAGFPMPDIPWFDPKDSRGLGLGAKQG